MKANLPVPVEGSVFVQGVRVVQIHDSNNGVGDHTTAGGRGGDQGQSFVDQLVAHCWLPLYPKLIVLFYI